MHKGLIVPVVAGLAAVAMVVAGVLYMQRGAHVELKGSVLKVRTQALDENSTAMVIDFRITNPSDYKFIVRRADVTIEDQQNRIAEAQPVAEMDAQRLFQYYPLLGQKFNDSLKVREQIQPRETQDRMLAVRFELPEKLVEARKKLTIRIEEVDGTVSEISR